MKLSAKLTRFPPIICRLLARRKVSATTVVPMTDAEICAASGLSIGEVKGLSWLKSWDGVGVDIMLAYSKACGVDFDDPISMKRNWAFLAKTGSATHLRRSPDWKTFYAPLSREAAKG